jgi:hypothetical protein
MMRETLDGLGSRAADVRAREHEIRRVSSGWSAVTAVFEHVQRSACDPPEASARRAIDQRRCPARVHQVRIAPHAPEEPCIDQLSCGRKSGTCR